MKCNFIYTGIHLNIHYYLAYFAHINYVLKIFKKAHFRHFLDKKCRRKSYEYEYSSNTRTTLKEINKNVSEKYLKLILQYLIILANAVQKVKCPETNVNLYMIKKKKKILFWYSSFRGLIAKRPKYIVKLGCKISPNACINIHIIWIHTYITYLCILLHYFMFLCILCKFLFCTYVDLCMYFIYYIIFVSMYTLHFSIRSSCYTSLTILA